MTQDETSIIRDRYLEGDCSSAEQALFLMGYIQALRDMRELAEAGAGPCAEAIIMLCAGKEETTVAQLRRV
jgi:hypothetical protein